MQRKEFIIRNVKTGEEKRLIGTKTAAEYLGISTPCLYSRYKNHTIVNDEEIIIPGLKYYKKKSLSGKHFQGNGYSLDSVHTKTVIFSSSRVMVDGDTEDTLKAELSAYIQAKIKEIDVLQDKFILTTSTYTNKLFYEVVFLFKQELSLKEKDQVIQQFLPY